MQLVSTQKIGAGTTEFVYNLDKAPKDFCKHLFDSDSFKLRNVTVKNGNTEIPVRKYTEIADKAFNTCIFSGYYDTVKFGIAVDTLKNKVVCFVHGGDMYTKESFKACFN